MSVSPEAAAGAASRPSFPSSTRVYQPSPLVLLAADTLAQNPAYILADPGCLAVLPEEMALLVLGCVMQRLRLTAPLAQAFAASGHPKVYKAISSLDLFALMGTVHTSKESCRV